MSRPKSLEKKGEKKKLFFCVVLEWKIRMCEVLRLLHVYHVYDSPFQDSILIMERYER